MVSTLSLVPTQAVVYAASVNSTNGTTTSASDSKKSGAAGNYAANPLSWKYGVALGGIMASTFVLAFGL